MPFAPYDKPEIAVAVVVEHGEHGGAAAAPIAGRILRAYFDGKKPVKKTTGTSVNRVDEDDDEENQPSVSEPRTGGDAADD